MNVLLKLFSFDWTDPLRPNWDESDKIAFSLFDKIDIAWYAIMILMAIVLSIVIGYFGFAKRLGANSDLLSEGVVIGVLAGVIGGRAWYVIADIVKSWTNSDYTTTFTNLKSIIDIRSGGLAISGAVLLVGIALFVFCKYRKLKLLYILEIVLPLVMLSQVLGRWGNFFNFEAHGGLIQVEGLKEALKQSSYLPDNILQLQRDTLWFLPDFIVDRMYIYDDVAKAYGYCQPCFLYEGIANLIGFTAYMLIRRFVKKGVYVGDGISFYLVWYGIVRFFIEMMRTDAQTIGNSNIPVVMVYAVIMVVVGIIWFIIRRVKKIQLESCYDALYGNNSTIFIDPNQTKTKNKKNKIELKTEDCENA